VNLQRINSLLVICIVTLNLYLVAMPFAPKVAFWLKKRDGHTQATLQKAIHTKPTTVTSKAEPAGNRLTIPSITIDEPIQESNTVMRGGVWHITHTSTPDKGGNTVIIGHRFTYTNPFGTFYNLDKLKLGDEVGVTWHGKKYIYDVAQTKVVEPTEMSVEDPSTTDELTLYTCTPLYFPKNRLVVISDLKEIITP